ncbi:probable glutathione S-transferase isoform X1 [Cynara cardunculus var. scolymus]|uniref:probable glutathione S-transferase isoform X1 n=1 Tax=Cynara cardunculus var. scolymus TaxID=59895 RepID=UPI000D62C5D0|nr:probable glutathione S-transferase isoform X1 [Cynara cardunculus var. scolymus]
MGEVKLFRTWSSPFALRVVWALKLKGVEYETIYEDLANKSSSLLEYNPVHKKVPVLLHNGIPICESLVILEYIDETWNEGVRFLPKDPLARATARFWAKFNDEQVFPSFFRYFMRQGEDQEKAKEKVLENLKFVEEHLKGKKFFDGEVFGFLDLVFGWLVCYPGVINKAINLKLLDEQMFPNLCTWMEQFGDVPVIKETWPDEEALIHKFHKMREGLGIYIYTKLRYEAS